MESLDDRAKGGPLSNGARREPLALGTGAVVLALWTHALWVQVPNYNYGDSFGPTLVELGELKLVPDSAVTWFYGGAKLVLPWMIASACRVLHVTPEFMHTAIAIVTVVTALSAMGWAAARIAGSAWAGVLAMAAIPFAWPFALSVGYSAPFWTGYTTAGYWGLGWTCAVWGVWFVSPASGIGSYVPFALAGFEFLSHPTWAIVALGVLGTGEVLEAAAASDRIAAVRASVARVALALAIASPQIVYILGNLNQPVRQEDLAGWWPLIQFRKSFHYYLWDGIVSYARLGLAGVVTVGAAALVWPRLSATERRRTMATGIAIAAFAITAYVAMEVLHSRSISSMVLTRSGSLLPAVAIAFCAAAAIDASVRGTITTAVAAWIVLLAIALPVETPGYQAWSQAVALRLPDDARAIGNFWLPLLIAVIATIALLVARRPVTGRESLAIPMTAAAAILLLTAVKLPMIPAVQGAVLPTATWNGLTDYLREQTPKESLIVVPPYPYSIASARRSFVQDYSLLGAAVYNPPMTGFELGVLRNMYGIDLTGMTHDDIKQYLAKNDGILCLLERKYDDLVGSEARVGALKAAYPSIAYVVGFKPGVMPLEWSCAKYDGPVLNLPIAYQNDEYVLYDVRRLDPRMASHR